MKHSEIISAVVGATFFAVPYIAGITPVGPALAIGSAAFLAGELVLRKDQIKSLKETNLPLYKVLETAKSQNKHIESMISQVESESVKLDLKSINESVNKIIKTIEKEPNKEKKVKNFFDYYLPVTIKLVDRYNQIEDQRITSTDSKKFMQNTESELSKMKSVFAGFLNALYESDMTDANVEMKVLNSMLKADGLDKSDLVVKENEKDE